MTWERPVVHGPDAAQRIGVAWRVHIACVFDTGAEVVLVLRCPVLLITSAAASA